MRCTRRQGVETRKHPIPKALMKAVLPSLTAVAAKRKANLNFKTESRLPIHPTSMSRPSVLHNLSRPQVLTPIADTNGRN